MGNVKKMNQIPNNRRMLGRGVYSHTSLLGQFQCMGVWDGEWCSARKPLGLGSAPIAQAGVMLPPERPPQAPALPSLR